MASKEIAEHFKFFGKGQLDGESFDEFYDRLKDIAKNCGFGQNEESMLKYQIVSGIANKALRTLFLQENPSLHDVILRCRTSEYESNVKFEEMPDELILKIMSKLSFAERKRTRLVSKRWYEISYTKSLIKHDWTVVPSFNDLRDFQSPSCHSNVRVKNCEGIDYCVNFWRTFGNNIQAIDLSHFDEEMFAFMWYNILLHCPKVKVISLKAYFPKERSNINERSPCSQVCLEHLQKLTLDLAFLSNSIIEALEIILDAPNLSQIILDCETAEKPITEWITKFPNLRQLRMTFFEVDSSVFNQTLQALTNLTHIYLGAAYSTGAIDHTFFQSKKMDQVIAIDLSGDNWTADTYMAVFSTMRPNLINVRLNDNCCEILDQILPNMPNIKVLGLGDQDIDEEDVQTIARYNEKLKYLDLKRIDLSRCPSLNVLKSLRRIILGNSSGVINVLQQLCLPELEIIDVRIINHTLTVPIVNGLVERCPSLYWIIGGEHLCGEVSEIIAGRKPSRSVGERFNFWSAAREL